MSVRVLLAILLSTLCSLSAAQAQVKVVSAYYGRQKPERSIDVAEMVQQRFNTGVFKFRVEPRAFGVNPNPGRSNVLIVQYSFGGQKAFAQASDGELFTLPGFGAPANRVAPGTPLRFENGSLRSLYVYELDRWGAWRWKAQLDPRAVYTARGQPGDNWIVTDRSGRVVRQVKVSANMTPIQLR